MEIFWNLDGHNLIHAALPVRQSRSAISSTSSSRIFLENSPSPLTPKMPRWQVRIPTVKIIRYTIPNTLNYRSSLTDFVDVHLVFEREITCAEWKSTSYTHLSIACTPDVHVGMAKRQRA